MTPNPHYQYDYSRINPDAVFDSESRIRKAGTILSVLRHHFVQGCGHLALLDIGCSSGIISNDLALHFFHVTGIDIDENAIRFAQSKFQRPNLSYQLGDCLHPYFADNTFEVVICAHVYEHVPDARQLMSEIKRVLKPGGVCYFAAGNRLAVLEPHYGLPFLSWLPQPIANAYLNLFRKRRFYYEKHKTLNGLRGLVDCFYLHDYTLRMIEKPQSFELEYLLRPGSRRHRMAVLLARHFFFLCPTFIWLLEKPSSPSL